MAGAGFPKDGIHGCVQNTAVGDSRKMGKGKKKIKGKGLEEVTGEKGIHTIKYRE